MFYRESSESRVPEPDTLHDPHNLLQGAIISHRFTVGKLRQVEVTQQVGGTVLGTEGHAPPGGVHRNIPLTTSQTQCFQRTLGPPCKGSGLHLSP